MGNLGIVGGYSYATKSRPGKIVQLAAKLHYDWPSQGPLAELGPEDPRTISLGQS